MLPVEELELLPTAWMMKVFDAHAELEPAAAPVESDSAVSPLTSKWFVTLNLPAGYILIDLSADGCSISRELIGVDEHIA